MRHLALILFLSLACTSCLVSSQSDTSYEGKHVDQSTLDKVKPGVTKEFVEAAFGEPSKTEALSEGKELWTWSYTKTSKSHGHVFLLFATSNNTKEERSVCVQFADGVVTKSWRN